MAPLIERLRRLRWCDSVLAVAQMAVRDALNSAIDDEMGADERVFLIGEEVGEYQGAYKVRLTPNPSEQPPSSVTERLRLSRKSHGLVL